MANTFSIDKHPKKDLIKRDIIHGVTVTQIAKNYGITTSSVQRYKAVVQKELAALWDKECQKSAATLNERYEEIAVMLKKQLLACEEWLQDPDNPDKYTVIPRSSEIKIVLEWYDSEDHYHRRTTTLREAIAEIEKSGKMVGSITFNNTDTRKIILETAKVLQQNLDSIARLQGSVSDIIIAQNNPTIILSQIGEVVLNKVNETDAREAIVAELRKLQAEGQ